MKLVAFSTARRAANFMINRLGRASGPRIRPIAIAVIRRGDHVLAFEMYDPSRDVTFCRPLGGGIEFGELSEDAVRRELLEEIGAELTNVRLIGVLENRFHGFERDGHEIVFVFDADLADRSLYEHDDLGVVTDVGAKVAWQPLSRFASGEAALYPDGLAELLR
jgi:ADP-ribose pyrophosphatase YjhB (NUDIX family)